MLLLVFLLLKKVDDTFLLGASDRSILQEK